MPFLSAALGRISPSPTLAMTSRTLELQAKGIKVVGLAAGEPDFDTPDFIKDAAIEAIRAGKTKYTNVDGTPELKAAIVAKFARENGLTYEPSQISVNSGGKHTLFNALVATVEAPSIARAPAIRRGAGMGTSLGWWTAVLRSMTPATDAGWSIAQPREITPPQS